MDHRKKLLWGLIHFCGASYGPFSGVLKRPVGGEGKSGKRSAVGSK